MRYLALLIQPIVAVLCVSLIHTETFAKEIEDTDQKIAVSIEQSDGSGPISQDSETSAPSQSDDGAAQAATQSKPAPPPTTLRVSINLSSQRMTVSANGASLHSWPISSGRAGYRTPTGSYRPQWLARMHYSKKYQNAPMPHSVFFHRGFAIHGTYATGRLGGTASHGCIRLAPGNAKKLFRLVQKHGYKQTRISIHGVARDKKRWIAKKSKRRYRKKQASQYSWWSTPSYSKPAPKRYKRKKKSKITYYKQPAYRWPGD